MDLPRTFRHAQHFTLSVRRRLKRRSRPASVFFGAGDVPSTPSGLGDAFLAQSPCYSAKLVAGHPAGAFSRRSGEYAAHTAGSYSLVSHTSAACTLGPLLEDLPTQPCAVRRTVSGQLHDGGGGSGGGSGVDSSVGAYEEDGTGREDGTDGDLDVELDDDSPHADPGERKSPHGGGGGGGRTAAAPCSYAAAVAAAGVNATSSPHTPHSAHRQHHPHGRHGAAAIGAPSAAAAMLTAADLSSVAAAAAAAAAAASMGAGGKPSPWATSLLNRARAAETRAARLESRLREQRGAMEDLQRQLGEREGQLASLRAEVAALRRQQQQHGSQLHSPQPAHAAAPHPRPQSQLQAQLAAVGARLRSSSTGGAGAGGACAGAGGSFTGGSACDDGVYVGGVAGSGGSYTCGGMVTAPPCYNAPVGPLAAAAAALTTPTTPEMHHHHHHHHHAHYSALHSSPSGDELGQLCDADRLSPPPPEQPTASPAPQSYDAAAAELTDSTEPLAPAASLPRLDTPQVSELLPCFFASSPGTGAIAIAASASGSFHLSAAAVAAAASGAAITSGPLSPVQEEDLYLASARSSASGDGAASPAMPAAQPRAAAASPFAALAAEALHAEVDRNAPPCRTSPNTGSGQPPLCGTASLPGGAGGGLLQSHQSATELRRRTDAAHRALLVSASQAHRLAAALEAERAASEALREELRDWRSCCLDNHKQLAAARRRLAAAAVPPPPPPAQADGHGSL